MNYVTFLPARRVGTAVPEPSWKASAGLEAHAANMLDTELPMVDTME